MMDRYIPNIQYRAWVIEGREEELAVEIILDAIVHGIQPR